MAALPLEEATVMSVLNLGQHCTQPLSEEIVRRITAIRDKCIAAEKHEFATSGGGGWRRGLGGGGGGGGGGSNGGGNGGGGNPRYHGGGGGGGGMSNRWRTDARPQQGQGPNHRPSNGGGAPRTPGEHKHVPRYVSLFTNTEQTVEDKILNSVIHGKLQTLAAQNYDEVKQFLIQVLDGNEVDFLSDVMKLIFTKASLEEMFCPHYARLVSELSKVYPSWQAEFEKFYGEYLTIFEEVPETACKDYEMFVQRNREKQKRLGYSQFLAELTRHAVITTDQLLRLYSVILDQIKIHAAEGAQHEKLNDEYVGCLRAMTKAFAECNTPRLLNMRDTLAKGCDKTIEDLLARRTQDFPGLSREGSYGLMDCLDIFRGSSF
jgi:hypothetical protein